MSIQNGINLVRNIHNEIIYKEPSLGLPQHAILLETASNIDPPYLIVRRGDELYPPFSRTQPIAHLMDLEYVISEADAEEEELILSQDVVLRVRRLDELFMAKIASSPSFRRTGDVDEGLSDDRPAYLLTRVVEVAADIQVRLADDIVTNPMQV